MTETSGSQDEGTGSRRGRRPIRPAPESGPVALLAHRLWQLKEEAGDPSFADMASRLGAAASKSSLAAAARGSTLPSWETTWEFVRVLAVDRLGRDPEEVRREWRAHWQRAANTSDSQNETFMEPHPPTGPQDHPSPGEPLTNEPASGDAASSRPASGHPASAEPTSGPTVSGQPVSGHTASGPAAPTQPTSTQPTSSQSSSAESAGRLTSVRRLTVLAAMSGVIGVSAALLVWLVPIMGEDEPRPSPTPSAAQHSTPHDDSVFERDVTYPDGTLVTRGSSFDKTWRIRNAGTIHWEGRYLTRMNDTPCQAPKRVGIGPVPPGESVDITVRVRAADDPGRCKIYWKMTDADGTPLLAGKKPIFLDVTVN
ncbi:NBR1-Ig-like domain-containing protein [Nonomuraea sp. NPDC046802]|uniref:NBR1-Ig-like domain-containing protein n=1 Tax=Nonomuraea sp. NPDC046802 TaxID=3154919 RepID=UPI0033E60BD9